MKRYFILGTDTNCGKTYATCQLMHYFQEKHARVMAVKPVVTGCWEQEGQLINEDILQLQSMNGHSQQQISPWRFKPPISPHLAAAESGRVILAQAVANFCDQSAFKNLDYLLIEGAGGLMVPLNDQETWLEFLTYSQIPVILVVGMRLGCLNHALLTDFALKTQQVNTVGWIANCIDKDMLMVPANIRTLTIKMNSPLLATIPYNGKLIATPKMERLETPSIIV